MSLVQWSHLVNPFTDRQEGGVLLPDDPALHPPENPLSAVAAILVTGLLRLHDRGAILAPQNLQEISAHSLDVSGETSVIVTPANSHAGDKERRT